MACQRCEREEACHLKHLGPLCRRCFCEVMQRRVRKHLRRYRPKPEEGLILLDDGTLRTAVAKFLLDQIAKDMPLTMEVSKTRPQTGRVVLPLTASQLSARFLGAVLHQEDFPSRDQREIWLLEPLTDAEVELFARFKAIDGRSLTKLPLQDLVAKIEKEYPGSTFGLVRARDALDE